ncbi:hypothetical protein B0H14DRAFT_3854310 [Mycena olivaceomarginata]|nr:hypothetical protein B0H14DRAFT_3854310 [Mycena olivaceomarginata]
MIVMGCASAQVSPNELSIIDAPAVSQILGLGGLEKGRYYESGRHSTTPPSIVCVSGEAHTAKHRVWNRAMSSAALREYEPLIAKRTSQLISCLRDQGSDGASNVDWCIGLTCSHEYESGPAYYLFSLDAAC